MDSLPRDDATAGAVSHAMKRHWLLISVATLLVALIVGAFMFLKGKSYVASTTLLIRPLTGNALSPEIVSGDQNTTVAMETEAQLVGSAAVTRLVNRDLGTSLNAASSTVAGSVPINTQLILITYRAKSPTVAERYARAYAAAFLNYRTAQAKAVVTSQLAALRSQESSTNQLYEAAARAAAQKNPPPGAATDQARYATRLAALQTQIGEVQATDTDPGSVVVPAQRPSRAGTMLAAVVTVVAALVGFAFGVAMAVWRERRADHIWSPAELTIGDVPLLATLPASVHGSNPVARDDAIRHARVAVLAATRPGTVVAVAGIDSADPAAAVAVDLARSLAAAEYRVVVIDAGMAEPGVAAQIGIDPATAGLSELLLRHTPLDVSALPKAAGVTVLPGGRRIADVRDRFAGPAPRNLLRQLRESFDYVLITSQPASTGDGLAVIQAADGVLFVATDERTTHDDVSRAKDAVERLDVPIVGIVVQAGHAEPRQIAQSPSALREASASESAGQRPRPATERDAPAAAQHAPRQDVAGDSPQAHGASRRRERRRKNPVNGSAEPESTAHDERRLPQSVAGKGTVER